MEGSGPLRLGSTCTQRALWNGCKTMGDMGFCQTTCGKWGA